MAVGGASAGAAAQDLTIYADALAAGWQDWSYSTTVDVASTAQVYAGTQAIAVQLDQQWGALSLRISPALAGDDYVELRFRIYGGAGGTALRVATQPSDAGPESTPYTLTAAAGSWSEVVVPLSALGNPAAIARVNIGDNDNAVLGTTFYVDDLRLIAVGPPPVEELFVDGFDDGTIPPWCTQAGCGQPGGPAVLPLIVSTGTTDVAGAPLPSHTVSWTDGGGESRQAVMVDQRAAGAGYLRRYTYRVAGGDRVCTGVASNGGAIQGFGYVTNHLGDPGDWGGAWGNWSVGVAGTTTQPLAGAHHAILEFAMPGYTLAGKTIPTTVQWLFATGRSHPLFAVAQDARAHTGGNLGGDSRTPYGTMEFPGDGTNLAIAGVSWGDTRKFVTLIANTTVESTFLTSASGWRYDQVNTIPYVLAWTSTVDAEQGTVATTPIVVQDQGSDPRVYPATGFGRGQQDLDGPPPQGDDWTYQLMNYPDVPAGGTTDKKVAWGMNSGALGGFDDYCGPGCGYDLKQFSRHRDSTTPFTGSRENGLLLAYSTFVVFGTHAGGVANGTTGQAVREMENVQAATLTAATGTVRTQGPRGVGPAANATITYSPAGYNPVYATWDVDAAGNAADVTLTVQAGKPILNPLFVVHGYGSAVLPAVTLDGAAATADVDYAATLDAANDRLWITVLRTVATSLDLAVAP